MDEEIRKMFRKVRLRDDEKASMSEAIPVSLVEGDDYGLWAVAKVLSKKEMDKDAVMRVMKTAWGTKHEVSMSNIRGNMFLIKFACKEDKLLILEKGPWNFDKFLFNLVEFNPILEIDDYDFSTFDCWVRMYDLPLAYLKKDLVINLARHTGEVMFIDNSKRNGGWGEYVRVKVNLRVDQPLTRAIVTKSFDGKGIKMVPLLYERLPYFCHWCSIVNHVVGHCPNVDGMVKGDNDLPYGEWLRYVSVRKKGLESDSIPGIERVTTCGMDSRESTVIMERRGDAGPKGLEEVGGSGLPNKDCGMAIKIGHVERNEVRVEVEERGEVVGRIWEEGGPVSSKGKGAMVVAREDGDSPGSNKRKSHKRVRDVGDACEMEGIRHSNKKYRSKGAAVAIGTEAEGDDHPRRVL